MRLVNGKPTDWTVVGWLRAGLADDDLWNNTKNFPATLSEVVALSRYVPEGLLLRDVTSVMVKAVKVSMEQDYAPATVRKRLSMLSKACKVAVERGELDAMPLIPSVTVQNTRDRVITRHEEMIMRDIIMLDFANGPHKETKTDLDWDSFGDLTALLMDTGMRIGEALAATQSWLKEKHWVDPITLRQHTGMWLAVPKDVTKSGKPRDIPLSKRALRVIRKRIRWCTNTGEPLLFPWGAGSKAPNYLLGKLREAMKEKGIDFDDVVLHTFRHTCATRLAEGGMDLVGLRDWLGHSDIKMTANRYLHLMNGHLFKGVAILDRN